ncbi:hypothetical protein [Neokomagataea anthophila]|uniref:Uncharacterized protein n=1 Tax=Neokomagataea anthophila TaxID=2826925 RepID=A0ABS5E707_9PROT|nr:hypothetical protein [Neokomagataea anthophila]MBR0559674.1 hypothetical protein [Neokomagataea anthophila]
MAIVMFNHDKAAGFYKDFVSREFVILDGISASARLYADTTGWFGLDCRISPDKVI